jgi:hypothetical protein
MISVPSDIFEVAVLKSNISDIRRFGTVIALSRSLPEAAMNTDLNSRNWAIDRLSRARAVRKCNTHGVLFCAGDDDAVRRTVQVGRLLTQTDQTADDAELALLETYLGLPDSCPNCK